MVPETLVYILKQSRMGRMSNRLIAKILLPDVHSSKNRINRFRWQALMWTTGGFVCFYPFTHAGGHTPSGGAWDPKWGFDSYFLYDFFEFELKLTGKGSADPTQLTFQHNMV